MGFNSAFKGLMSVNYRLSVIYLLCNEYYVDRFIATYCTLYTVHKLLIHVSADVWPSSESTHKGYVLLKRCQKFR